MTWPGSRNTLPEQVRQKERDSEVFICTNTINDALKLGWFIIGQVLSVSCFFFSSNHISMVSAWFTLHIPIILFLLMIVIVSFYFLQSRTLTDTKKSSLLYKKVWTLDFSTTFLEFGFEFNIFFFFHKLCYSLWVIWPKLYLPSSFLLISVLWNRETFVGSMMILLSS